MAKTPTMTKAHFQLIADVVKGFSAGPGEAAELARHFAVKLADTNPNFDRWKFIKACLGE